MMRQKWVNLLIPIIWLGFALRLHELALVPLRGDEAFSALYWANLPLSTSLIEIAPLDPHPPLAFVAARFWRFWIGGIDSPTALRSLSVLGNIIGIPAIFALAWRLSGRSTVALASALLWAVHPYEIWHSQDFRNYPVWAGMSVTTLWLGLRLIERPSGRNWLLYGLVASASVFLFYTELFMMLALAIVAIVRKRAERGFLPRFLALQAGIAGSVVSAFLLLQAERILSGAYPGNVEAFYAPDYLTRLIPTLVIGDAIPQNLSLAWAVICIALAGLALVIARHSRPQIVFVASVALVPLFLLGLASQGLSLFHPRYVLATVPAFILIIAIGSDHLAGWLNRALGWQRNLLLLGLLLPWVALSFVTLDAYFNDPAFRKAPAWDELGAFLNKRVSSDELVIQLSADSAFAYYYKGEGRETALPIDSWQPTDDIIAALEDARGDYSSIYVVSNAIASWTNANVVETWAHEQLQPVLLSHASGLGIRQFKEWTVANDFESTLARFAETVDLVDYSFFAEPLPTGEILLWLYWRPLAQTTASLKSYVHIYGAVNPASGSILWSQDDQYPQDGKLDTRTWQPAAVIREVYYLPADSLGDGEYDLSIGWYDPESGIRLPTLQNKDHFLLETFAFP